MTRLTLLFMNVRNWFLRFKPIQVEITLDHDQEDALRRIQALELEAYRGRSRLHGQR